MFNFDFNWDWSGFNLDALNEPAPVLDNNWLAQVEREIAALSTVVTEAVVNSPAVIEAPVNREPEIARVEQAVEQVVQALAPVVAPNLPDYIIQLSTPLFIDEIAYSPEVIAAPAGQTVPAEAVQTIVENIVNTAAKDETFVNSVAASIPNSIIKRLPPELREDIADTVSQAIETVAKAPDMPDTFATYASSRQQELADEYDIQTQLPPEITRGEIQPRQEVTTPATSDLVYRGGASVTPDLVYRGGAEVEKLGPSQPGLRAAEPTGAPAVQAGGPTLQSVADKVNRGELLNDAEAELIGLMTPETPIATTGITGGTTTDTTGGATTGTTTGGATSGATAGTTTGGTTTGTTSGTTAGTTTGGTTSNVPPKVPGGAAPEETSPPSTTTTQTSATTGVFTGEGYKNEYKTDLLLLDGKPFTGIRNGIEYKDGLPTTATREDVLEANREARMQAEAEARAKSNPLYDFKNRPTAQEPDDNYVYYYSWIGGVNTGYWKLYQAPNTPENLAKYLGRSVGGATQATAESAVGANTLINQPTVTPTGVMTDTGAGNTPPGPGTGGIPGAGGTGGTTGGTTTGGTTTGGTTTASGGTTTTTTPAPGTTIPTQTLPSGLPSTNITTTPTTTVVDINQQSALKALETRFANYGLSTLIPKIRELAINGANESTITLQLQETEEYRQRFKANQERLKKGLAVLSPGDYINLEDNYRQILRAYGLNQFDRDDYVSQFIENDVSSAELSSRVQTAVQRVQNSDPAVLNTLTRFYGIGQNDLVAYVLDPDQQFQKIERQVAAAEIGAAAKLQGFDTGVAVAEQLAAQGISQAEARKGYSTIADILPSAEKLSAIYGTTLQGYGLAEAEQEVFNTLASAQRKRRKLVEREVAEFGGASGVSKASLRQQVGGQF